MVYAISEGGYNMKMKIFKTLSGWWVVLVWDPFRGDFSLWWSGSKKLEDVRRVVADLMRYERR